MAIEDDYMTIPETAQYLKVSTTTVRRQITEGIIPATRIGTRIIVSRKRLVEVLNNKELTSCRTLVELKEPK